ncbi:hypothetical protein CTheo_934 [Ceratobasidium theobromae]|uniref:Protein kinase domain-containing protein n=1 Tax=Ceratobasidium theobromae TaxID=1582974 RepID=A0A5N5QWZ7_9AGAM|nr:hypothetical protein CTheo_934 [Ceratobasidium theobromae]
MRLLSPPENADLLLESRGYVCSVPSDNEPRGHVIRATKVPDRVPVFVKCVRKASAEARMLALFRTLQRQGKNLPVIGVLELIKDASSDIELAVLEDWGPSLAELGRLALPDFFNILRQCFEASRLGFEPFPRVVIIDFETSRHFKDDPAQCRARSHPHSVCPHPTTEIPPEFRAEGAQERRHCAYKLDIFALGVLTLRFAKSSGFDCPHLVLLAEPLVECNPLRRPTAIEALVWFHKWSERVGISEITRNLQDF